MTGKEPQAMQAADLFVVLDKAYRRRARRCGRCGFSLPYPVFRDDDAEPGAWTVMPSADCSHDCTELLEELVGNFQKEYRLARQGGPNPH
jgi:hypothetical protein